jgi:V8-like Glu-specific endopeptidase
MAYYAAVNTGKGFITHEENELAHIAGYPGDIWVTENTTWASRVGAISKTKEEAQALVDATISGSVYPEDHPNAGEQVVVTLP